MSDALQCTLADKSFDYNQFYKQIVEMIYDELAKPVPEGAPAGTRNAGKRLMDWWNSCVHSASLSSADPSSRTVFAPCESAGANSISALVARARAGGEVMQDVSNA